MNKSSDLKKSILFYMHAGSKNHGCEAIVDSLCHILSDYDVNVISYRANEDRMYNLKDLCTVYQEKSFANHKLWHVIYYIYSKLSHDRESFIRFRYGKAIDACKYPVAVSIGGDNYCYDNMLSDLKLSNSAFNKAGVKTVLLGCSIEPEVLENREIVEDLKKYSAILARESITYEALVAAGLKNVNLIPDSAFTLPVREVTLPKEFKENNTVGVNISPMIIDNEKVSNIAFENYCRMTEYILTNTDMNVALIPHVVWENNDDRLPCKKLYDYFASKGYENRLCLLEDADCETLKGYISKCRFFVGARTHSTIAAYSTCVPTLVVGYSVKAMGIAKDLFGDELKDDMVLPVQSMDSEEQLLTAFKKLMSNESVIKEKLNRVIPQTVAFAAKVSEFV